MFVLDTSYRFVVLDREKECTGVWSYYNYNRDLDRDTGQVQKDSKGNVIDVKLLLDEMILKQGVSKMPTDSYQHIYQIPDLAVLEKFFSLRED